MENFRKLYFTVPGAFSAGSGRCLPNRCFVFSLPADLMQSNELPSAEYGLIAQLQSIVGDIESDFYSKGIGDDAAVRRSDSGNQIILTTDLSVEEVHFSLSYMTMHEVGYRAMVTNLSDCAAMGAHPDSALIQLVVPRSGNQERAAQIRELYRGFEEACREWGFPIVGGDLSLGTQWVIGITLLGRVAEEKRVLLRRGAQPGDGLWVSGVPGRSAAGLEVLRRWGRDGIPDRFHVLAEAHIRPVPRIALGSLLAEDATVHTMMDLSDGLSKDCRTLSYENRCGIILSSDSSQVPPAMIQLSRETGRSWEEWFFHGGEDYELLFAASPEFDVSRCTLVLPEMQPIRIGEFSDEIDGVMTDSGEIRTPLRRGGFDHIHALLF